MSAESSFDLQLQERRAEALAVRVERERGGDAAGQRALADELQRGEQRELESAHIPQDDSGQVLLDGARGDLLAQERKILRAVGDDRQDRRVALVARTAVRQLVQLAFHDALSKRVSCGVTLSREMR